MKKNYPKPDWHPEKLQSKDWIARRLNQLLKNKSYAIFSYGTFVVSQENVEVSSDNYKKILHNFISSTPDFKVRNHPSGDYLITFKGGIGSIVSGDFLKENFEILTQEALSKGKLKSEIFENPDDVKEIDLIAGLYARALLYMDIENSNIVSTI